MATESEQVRMLRENELLKVENERLLNLLVDRESLIAEYIMTEKQVGARAQKLEAAIQSMKRTSIGSDRNAPEGTDIWFMFADEREAALAKGES